MTYNKLEDSQLLVLLSQKNERAFDIVFEKYRHKIYTFSVSILHEPALAQDVVQDVMIKLWQMEERLLEVKNLDQWLRVMTRNRTIDILRSKKHMSDQLSYFSCEEQLRDNTTQEQILYKDLQHILNRAIAGLPIQQQRVYQLIEVEGFNNKEVANELGLTPATVQTHLKLARRKLRAYLLKYSDKTICLLLLLFI
ncbi:RNA polymerase sigma-70 factor [Sphingobacterium sp. UT-1RO-CII-1]|uniref:RNA polymerase sigma factor n=1 Tax=Sphingobacterium sp. UT-1RO-CII-1 TaxID=2995225 RepID=UPI00227B1D24|nr:RNA polymerase sigma-70 factor [Sphingobacterium sp. UT-1RO-CII-1]MCY4780307.1 RNA polymerase sigma-70 factor [Sphingobacterium sp. UT-1RO-CII-1]